MIAAAGSLMPGFNSAIFGSFHFATLPRNMSASRPPVSRSSPGLNSVQIENRNDATNDQGKLQKPKPLEIGRSQGGIRGSEINGSRPQA